MIAGCCGIILVFRLVGIAVSHFRRNRCITLLRRLPTFYSHHLTLPDSRTFIAMDHILHTLLHCSSERVITHNLFRVRHAITLYSGHWDDSDTFSLLHRPSSRSISLRVLRIASSRVVAPSSVFVPFGFRQFHVVPCTLFPSRLTFSPCPVDGGRFRYSMFRLSLFVPRLLIAKRR